ncbi:MAG TPA: hypothetical protein VF407_04065, partial [Polyangiaceae bacterium]
MAPGAQLGSHVGGSYVAADGRLSRSAGQFPAVAPGHVLLALLLEHATITQVETRARIATPERKTEKESMRVRNEKGPPLGDPSFCCV